MGETPMPRVCGIPQNMGETPMPREAGNRPAGGVEGGFAFCDLIVLLAMLAIVFGVIVPVAIANRARPAANRVKCASNLRQIGQAMLLYANGEKDGAYPRTLADLSGKAITTNQGFDCSDPADPRVGVNNVPASLFLLLRTQDISSEVFTCPSADSERDTFGGGTNVVTSRANFGDIERNLSYSVHNMFPDEAAARTEVRWNTSMSPEFAVMADKNPGVVEGSNVFAPAGPNDSVRAQHLANSMNHDKDGQNVLFGDGHAEFVANPWVGVKQDNIYTRAGSTALGPSFSPADAADSFLLPAATRVTAGEVTERVDPATVVVLMLAMALVAWLIYRVAVGRRRPPQRTS